MRHPRYFLLSIVILCGCVAASVVAPGLWHHDHIALENNIICFATFNTPKHDNILFEVTDVKLQQDQTLYYINDQWYDSNLFKNKLDCYK